MVEIVFSYIFILIPNILTKALLPALQRMCTHTILCKCLHIHALRSHDHYCASVFRNRSQSFKDWRNFFFPIHTWSFGLLFALLLEPLMRNPKIARLLGILDSASPQSSELYGLQECAIAPNLLFPWVTFFFSCSQCNGLCVPAGPLIGKGWPLARGVGGSCCSIGDLLNLSVFAR